MKKFFFFTVLIFTFALQLNAQILYQEDFDYPALDLITAHGWTAHSGAGTQAIDVVSPGLTFTGYPSSGIGNAAALDNNGEDANAQFTSVTSGAVYFSFMFKVDAIAVGYFIHLAPNPMTTDYRARFWTSGAGTDLRLGLSFTSSDTTFAAGTYTTGTTYLAVIKYEVVAGDLNDIASVYIFAPGDALSAVEPGTPTILVASGGTSADIQPGSVCVRQFNAAQNITVDGIRVSSSWDQIVPVELASFNASVVNNNVSINWTTATETNNSGFEVVRDGSKIAFVAGVGTSTEINKYAFTDKNVAVGSHSYQLVQIDLNGTRTSVASTEVDVANVVTKFGMDQNYPNPFNPSTKISYAIPQSGNVKIEVFNTIGQSVALLVNGFNEAGTHEVSFNAVGLNSGIYFYRIEANGSVMTKKMTLLK
ncbi:MAG: T9SS type A sorting domain-containing protein [Ignavibacteriaceae bacterium]|nr:T9SS type A sorting domain-containing protein [Ignavibacteriaceae bacterium]